MAGGGFPDFFFNRSSAAFVNFLDKMKAPHCVGFVATVFFLAVWSPISLKDKPHEGH